MRPLADDVLAFEAYARVDIRDAFNYDTCVVAREKRLIPDISGELRQLQRARYLPQECAA
jgi:hypothetical protein